MKNIKFTIIMMILCITLTNAVNALASVNSAYGKPTTGVIDNCLANVTLLNQDPYPAMPGEYVKLVFQVTGIDTAACDGTKFQLISSFPFSLDSDDGKRSVDANTYVLDYNSRWMIPYKVRIDKNAVEGDNEISVQYGGSSLNDNYAFKQTFNVDVENTQTGFEGVIQSVSGNQVTIAIANTGKNAANSVIVRVPQQSSFVVSGTNGQMVGNLNSGDYTTVGFSVSSRQMRNSSAIQSGARFNISQNTNNLLYIVVSYTDTIGERRNETLELPIDNLLQASNRTITANTASQGRPSQTSNSLPSWLIATMIIVIVGVAAAIFNKNRKKIVGFFNNKDEKNKEVPLWLKKEKQKKSP